MVYPNPLDKFVFIRISGNETPLSPEAYDMSGKRLSIISKRIDSGTIGIELVNPYHGLVIIKLLYHNSQKTGKVLIR